MCLHVGKPSLRHILLFKDHFKGTSKGQLTLDSPLTCNSHRLLMLLSCRDVFQHCNVVGSGAALHGAEALRELLAVDVSDRREFREDVEKPSLVVSGGNSIRSRICSQHRNKIRESNLIPMVHKIIPRLVL